MVSAAGNVGGGGGVVIEVYEHTCLTCGSIFKSKYQEHKYCGKYCRDKTYKSRVGADEMPRPKISHEVPLTERICLKCRKAFLSWGVGNRMCTRCRREPDREFGRW